MATDLLQLSTSVDAQYQQPNGKAFAPSINRGRRLYSVTFTPGIGAKQVNRWSIFSIVIGASATLTIDLQAGTYSISGGGASGNLTDLNNTAIAFARIKGVKVKLASTAGGSTAALINGTVTFSNSTFNAKLVSQGTAGGYEGWAEYWNPSATGLVTTNGALDLLTITNSSGAAAATVMIAIAGGAT
jgi:hypothetical protein